MKKKINLIKNINDLDLKPITRSPIITAKKRAGNIIINSSEFSSEIKSYTTI